MISDIKLEFPEFITHVPQSKNKWVKIGYNRIYASAHYTVRAAFVAAMHKYIEQHIPENVIIKAPVETELIIYAPVNFGNVKRLQDKKTKRSYVSWKPARPDYKANWDIGNLALVWLKCLDDMLIKRGMLKDDTIEYIRKSSYEFRPVENLKDRKLVYKIKTIKQ
jgi:hypothetical protein